MPAEVDRIDLVMDLVMLMFDQQAMLAERMDEWLIRLLHFVIIEHRKENHLNPVVIQEVIVNDLGEDHLDCCRNFDDRVFDLQQNMFGDLCGKIER